jgi:type IV secretory pathway component VirB8
MGFEEFFDQDNRRDRQSQNRQFANDNNQQSASSYNDLEGFKRQILNRLQINPQLKGLIIVGVIVLLVILVIAIILLMPLIMRLIGFVTTNGVQGVLDSIWKGTK